MAIRNCFGWVAPTVSVVTPDAPPLKTALAAATPGNEPCASVEFHTPITGIAFNVETKPCSSSAVTSIVNDRFPLTVSDRQDAWPFEQSNPIHHPPATSA